MAWFYLFIAGICEIIWAIGLKYTQGFTRIWPSIITVIVMSLSIFYLSRAIQSIPIGTAYAIWTGIGVIGTTALGILLFGESSDPLRLCCIFLIMAGIAGLRLLSS